MTAGLERGERFPALSLALVDGTTSSLPEDLGPGWSVLLFYRGHF